MLASPRETIPNAWQPIGSSLLADRRQVSASPMPRPLPTRAMIVMRPGATVPVSNPKCPEALRPVPFRHRAIHALP